jgi:hypothetical protein
MEILKNANYKKKTIQFLGFDIDHEGTSVLISYTTNLESCTEPKNIKDLQRFLGLINFVRDYSLYIQKKATAFYNLLKKTPHALNGHTNTLLYFTKLLITLTQLKS